MRDPENCGCGYFDAWWEVCQDVNDLERRLDEVLVLASRLPDDLTDLDALTADERDLVVQLVQRVKAVYDE